MLIFLYRLKNPHIYFSLPHTVHYYFFIILTYFCIYISHYLILHQCSDCSVHMSYGFIHLFALSCASLHNVLSGVVFLCGVISFKYLYTLEKIKFTLTLTLITISLHRCSTKMFHHDNTTVHKEVHVDIVCQARGGTAVLEDLIRALTSTTLNTFNELECSLCSKLPHPTV